MSFLEIPPEILRRPDLEIPREPWREFEPNSIAQGLAMASWAPAVGYSGRLGSAKSRTCCEGALFDACFWAKNRVLLARKRSTDLFATTFPIFMDEVLPPHLRRFYRPGAAGAPTLFLPNGSAILFIGLDEPMKLKSGQYGSIYVDQAEDLDEEEHVTVESRLRHRVRPTLHGERLIPLRRRVLYAFNPAGDAHWGNVMFRFRQMQELPLDHPERWRRVYRTTEPAKLLSGLVVPAGQIIREAVISRPEDNTENLPEGYMLEMSQKVGPWRDRFVLGLWGTFEGQVFPNYRESVHVIDRPGDWDQWGGFPPPSWPRFRSVDFGYGPGHPFVMQWWARRPATRAGRPAKDYLYQEIYWTGRGVAEHAATALRWDQDELAALNRGIERWNAEHPDERQLRPRRYLDFAGQWSDPASPGNNAILEQHGIVMDPAINDRLPRAQLFAERLEPVSIDPSNPGAPHEPRIVFVRTARREADPVLVAEGGKRPTQTFEEISGIRWLRKGTSDERGQKEDWVKDAEDGFDAASYLWLSERERGSMQVIAI